MTRQSAAFALSLRSFCLVVAGLWFTGVGDYAAAQSREPVQSLLEIRQNRVVVQQWDLSCGAAALATILKYQHGDPVTEKEVAIGMMGRPEYIENPSVVTYRQGFSLLDLKRFVDERGYNGVGLGHLDVDDLVEYAPIIVPISVHAYRHFVVFRGILNDRVLLADPAFGNGWHFPRLAGLASTSSVRTALFHRIACTQHQINRRHLTGYESGKETASC